MFYEKCIYEWNICMKNIFENFPPDDKVIANNWGVKSRFYLQIDRIRLKKPECLSRLSKSCSGRYPDDGKSKRQDNPTTFDLFKNIEATICSSSQLSRSCSIFNSKRRDDILFSCLILKCTCKNYSLQAVFLINYPLKNAGISTASRYQSGIILQKWDVCHVTRMTAIRMVQWLKKTIKDFIWIIHMYLLMQFNAY